MSKADTPVIPVPHPLEKSQNNDYGFCRDASVVNKIRRKPTQPHDSMSQSEVKVTQAEAR